MASPGEEGGRKANVTCWPDALFNRVVSMKEGGHIVLPEPAVKLGNDVLHPHKGKIIFRYLLTILIGGVLIYNARAYLDIFIGGGYDYWYGPLLFGTVFPVFQILLFLLSFWRSRLPMYLIRYYFMAYLAVYSFALSESRHLSLSLVDKFIFPLLLIAIIVLTFIPSLQRGMDQNENRAE